MDDDWNDSDTMPVSALPLRRPLLIAKGAHLFSQREVSGKATTTPSDRVTAEITAKFPWIVIVSTSLSRPIADFVKERHPATIIVPVIGDAVHLTVENLLKILREEFGVLARTPRNPRTMSWLNLEKFVDEPGVVIAGPDDYGLVGVEADRELTLNEMIAKRSDNDWI